MMSMNLRRWGVRVVTGLLVMSGGCAVSADGAGADPGWLSPVALAATPDGGTLVIGLGTAPALLVVDLSSREVNHRIGLPGTVSGLTLSTDGGLAYVTCPGPSSVVLEIDVPGRAILRSFAAGHTATAPVLSPDGGVLAVANRFDNNVSLIAVGEGRETARVAVEREPVAAAFTRDGKHVLVANQLHNGRADRGQVSAVVSVIDVAGARLAKTLQLPNGSGYLNDIRITPDGRVAVVTHILSRYSLPTTQLERGWMNTNAKTLIDVATMEIINTVLLDSVDRGAANPWGLGWSADGSKLAVAHAGTHEVSVIDFPGLLARLEQLPEEAVPGVGAGYGAVSLQRSDVPNDLAFLVGLRDRVALPEGELGPRALVVVGDRAYVANYFSDTLAVVNLLRPKDRVEVISLGPRLEPTTVRRGEIFFHDAGLCFQQWQSCASCHPGEGRADGLNWDLLNDGIGNPKNNRSLLYSHRLGPAMSMGVRSSAEEAVRAGIRHILFTVQPEEIAVAMDEYLKSLRPVPSPHLVNGGQSESARRGERWFRDPQVGCAECHPGELYSDMRAYEVGTHGEYDRPGDKFVTPTLVELWRTAPYLHDGSAATLREVFTERNPEDKHGRIRHLSASELDDLLAYLHSL